VTRTQSFRASEEGSDTLLSPGSILDARYRVDAFLAEGGMGRVYVGTQIQLGRKVALKLMRRNLVADEASKKRFLQEAVAASRLNHPNTIKVYDFGQVGSDVFIAMEFIDGVSLQGALDAAGALPLARTLRIIEQVAASLAEAHARGIVHRDLKPDNIFLAEIAGQRDFVKVLDFGIARVLENEQNTRITMDGLVCGTPDYMAPEQAIGGEIDGRSDLYALGVMFYELLTGQLPFVAPTPVAVLLKHQHEPPPELPDSVPQPVQGLVMRLLAKRAADRPASAEEVVEEIAAIRHDLFAAGQLDPGETGVRAARTGRIRASASPGPMRTRELENLAGGAPDTAPVAGEGASRRRWLPAAAAVLVVGLGALAFALTSTGDPAPAPAPGAPPAVAERVAAPAPATSAKVAISSDPDGAEIYLEGAFAGRTPARVDLPSGADARIELRKTGYVSASRTVSVPAGAASAEPVSVPLEPVQVVIRLESEPVGAQASVAGSTAPPCTTPCETRAAWGTRGLVIRFALPDHAESSQQIDVTSESAITVRATLSRLASRPAAREPGTARAVQAPTPAPPAPAAQPAPPAPPANPFRVVDQR
jgi:tRNA A-37 threonylcarbamoyl transferase component Bud32